MTEAFGKNPITSREFPVLLFDAMDTLLHFNPTREKILHDQLVIAGETRMPEEIEAAWIQVLVQINREAESTPDFFLSDKQWIERLLLQLNIAQAKDPSFISKVKDALSLAPRVVVAESVLQLCEELKERGYRLGIVSNSDERLAEMLRLHGILDLFDVVVTATADPHSRKPSPQSFLEALDDLEILPSQAIHIGASFAFDVIGARRAGLKAILYDPTHRELKALAELPMAPEAKVVSIESLRQNRRLQGAKVITRLEELRDFFS